MEEIYIIIQIDMKIQCKECWKEIEKRGNRELCIKCTNKKNKEIQAKYREEYRALLNDIKNND